MTLWERAKTCFRNGVGPSTVLSIPMVCVGGVCYDECMVRPRDRDSIPELVEAFGTVASRQKYDHLSAAAYLEVSPTIIRVRCERTGAVFSVGVGGKTLKLVSDPTAPVDARCTTLHSGSRAVFYM